MPGSPNQTSPTIVAFQFELLCQRDMEAAGLKCRHATGPDFALLRTAHYKAKMRWLGAVAATRECYRLSRA
jgi:hypothetical protein